MYLEKTKIHTNYLYPTESRSMPVRSMAKALKVGCPKAIEIVSKHMARSVPKGAVLVPMPGASGYADAMLKLVIGMQRYTGSSVSTADILYSAPRASQYQSKKNGVVLTPKDLALQAKKHNFELSRLVLVDNVADTGNTIKAARIALGIDAPAIVYAASIGLFNHSFSHHTVNEHSFVADEYVAAS